MNLVVRCELVQHQDLHTADVHHDRDEKHYYVRNRLCVTAKDEVGGARHVIRKTGMKKAKKARTTAVLRAEMQRSEMIVVPIDVSVLEAMLDVLKPDSLNGTDKF